MFFLIKFLKGPGQYDLRQAKIRNVKGGSSLANKSQRFNEKLKDNPGPGAYIIENKENKSQLPVELRVITFYVCLFKS